MAGTQLVITHRYPTSTSRKASSRPWRATVTWRRSACRG